MKETINRIIYQPQLFSYEYLPHLERIVEEFPYFQPAYFFLLKYYKNQAYSQYVNMLERCIWHISDKQLLHKFINQPFTSGASGTDEQVHAPSPATVSHVSVAETLPFSSRRDKDSLQETLSEALSQASQTEVSETFEKKILPDIDFELDETIEIIKPTADTDDLSLLKSPKEVERDDNFLELDEISEMLQEIKEGHPENRADEANESVENIQKNMNTPSATFVKKTTRQFALIDEFLEKLPHIKPQPVAETTSVTDISQTSVDVHDDFMTETFARILVKQGSYDRAIEIYRKLILKFPEKNTYFASQIDEIEKLKNNPKP